MTFIKAGNDAMIVASSERRSSARVSSLSVLSTRERRSNRSSIGLISMIELARSMMESINKANSNVRPPSEK